MDAQPDQDDPRSDDDRRDYYVEGGRVVFTAAYHRRRGYCCGNACRHCPYDENTGEGDAKRDKPVDPNWQRPA